MQTLDVTEYSKKLFNFLIFKQIPGVTTLAGKLRNVNLLTEDELKKVLRQIGNPDNDRVGRIMEFAAIITRSREKSHGLLSILEEMDNGRYQEEARQLKDLFPKDRSILREDRSMLRDDRNTRSKQGVDAVLNNFSVELLNQFVWRLIGKSWKYSELDLRLQFHLSYNDRQVEELRSDCYALLKTLFVTSGCLRARMVEKFCDKKKKFKKLRRTLPLARKKPLKPPLEEKKELLSSLWTFWDHVPEDENYKNRTAADPFPKRDMDVLLIDLLRIRQWAMIYKEELKRPDFNELLATDFAQFAEIYFMDVNDNDRKIWKFVDPKESVQKALFRRLLSGIQKAYSIQHSEMEGENSAMSEQYSETRGAQGFHRDSSADSSTYEKEKAAFERVSPDLLNELDVTLVLPYLEAAQIFNENHRAQILNDGPKAPVNMYSRFVTILLQHRGWWDPLLVALRKNGLGHLATKLEKYRYEQ